MQGSSVPRLISDLLKLLSICAFLKHLKILNSKFYGTNYTLAKICYRYKLVILLVVFLIF